MSFQLLGVVTLSGMEWHPHEDVAGHSFSDSATGKGAYMAQDVNQPMKPRSRTTSKHCLQQQTKG